MIFTHGLIDTVSFLMISDNSRVVDEIGDVIEDMDLDESADKVSAKCSHV